MVSKILKGLLSMAILSLMGIPSFCQDAGTVPMNQYAPTPKAMEMTRYGHMPPDLNSGVYSYDIPIYTYEDKNFSIPVSLHYSSSGFQPAKMSDEAGLHWTLIAGGAIVREIVGVDDFADGGLYSSGNQVSDSLLYYLIQPANSTHGVLCYAGNNTPSLYNTSQECSSDRYHFTFPGHSGSFVMNHAGSSFLVYGTDAGKGLYDVSWDGTSKSFTIQTGDGYSYRFGHGETNSSEKAREISWSREAVGSNESAVSLVQASTHIVTWLLDRITAPDGSYVQFNYISNRSYQDIPQTNDDVLTSFSRHPYMRPPENGTTYYKEASLTYTSYLSQIVVNTPLNSGETLQIEFQWTWDSNKEITGTENSAYIPLVAKRRHLSSISVKRGSTTLRQANLTYTANGRRPLLTNVQISGLGNYSMTYWTSTSSPLPGILCNGLDFWGYYNGKDYLNDSFFNPMSIDTDLNESISDTGMNPSWQYARLGLLKTITYPTGGITSIEYEPNKASKIVMRRKSVSGGIEPADPILNDPDVTNYYLPSLLPISSISNSFASDCGGVRVKTLTDNDGTSSNSFSYTYTSGIIQQFPRFYVGTIGNTPLYDPAIRFPGSSFDQRHVAYKTVTENYPDSSRVVTGFSSWEDQPDGYSVHRETIAAITWPNDPDIQTLYDNILREPDSRAYRRGLPLTRKTYDDLGNMVRNEVWSYDDIGSGYNTYALISGQYAWTARTYLCDRKPSTYDCTDWLDGTGVSVNEVTGYAYNGMGQLKKTTRTAGGHTEIQTALYPADIAGGIYPAMAAAGYRNSPVERRTILDGKVTGASLTTYYYNSSAGMYLPREDYHANLGEGIQSSSFSTYNGNSINSLYERDILYETHDSNGNLKKSINRDGVPTMYRWDSRGDKIAAVFVGADEGTRTYYVRGTVPFTETKSYSSVTEAQLDFVADAAGAFSLTFTPSNSSHTVSAKLDGNSLSIQSLGSGVQGTASPVTITAGAHTVTVTRTNPSLNLTGTLTVTYPVSGAVSQGGLGTDCLFEDFESGGGTTGSGFQSAKGRTSNYSTSVGIITNRTYVLDYMRKSGGTWTYVREEYTPTQSPLQLTIQASSTTPVDHIRFYPAGCSVTSYSWWPTGELRCEVDASGRFLAYEYDTYGRLTTVRDSEGKMVKQYTYHYQH